MVALAATGGITSPVDETVPEQQCLFTLEITASCKDPEKAQVLELAVCAVEHQQCWSTMVNPSLHGISWALAADAAQRSGKHCFEAIAQTNSYQCSSSVPALDWSH